MRIMQRKTFRIRRAPALVPLLTVTLLCVMSCSRGLHGQQILNQAQELKPGLAYVFFNGTNLTRPAKAGVDLQINLNSGTALHDYSQLWIGLLKAPVNGQITLSAEADDGLRLQSGGKTIIDGWNQSGVHESQLTVKKGQMLPLRVEFFQDGGTAHARLYWSWPGHNRVLIPASAFWHTEANGKLVARIVDGQADAGFVGNTTHLPEVSMDNSPNAPRPLERPQNAATPLADGSGGKRGVKLLSRGPQLFVDDYLIESSHNITRVLNKPQRHLAEPIIDGGLGRKDFNVAYDITVLKDEASGKYRMWYSIPSPLPDLSQPQPVESARTHVAYMESVDAINWERPFRQLADPVGRAYQQFQVSVFDRGRDFPDPKARYVMGYGAGSDLAIATSPDGFAWTYLRDVPQLQLKYHYDAFRLEYDPIRKHWIGEAGVNVTSDQLVNELKLATPFTWKERRRVYVQSISPDLVNWSPAQLLLVPDAQDPGETHFEGLYGVMARGDLLIGLVKVLRPDADPRGYHYGVEKTQLAWSRDGINWTRDREFFIDTDPNPDAWDHAFAAGSWQLIVGDEVYIYYIGIKEGHKIRRYTDRRIGLLKMPLDRYVARQAANVPGTLRTPLVTMAAVKKLSLNVDATQGEVKVRILDANNKPLADCKPLTNTNSVRAPLSCSKPFSQLAKTPVKLEFTLRDARLYGLNLE